MFLLQRTAAEYSPPAALLSPLSGKVNMNNGKTPGKYQLTHAGRWASAEQAYLGIYRKRETLLLLKVRADGKVFGGNGGVRMERAGFKRARMTGGEWYTSRWNAAPVGLSH